MLPLVWGLDGLVVITQKVLKSSSPLHLDSDQAHHQMEVAWQSGAGCTRPGSAPWAGGLEKPWADSPISLHIALLLSYPIASPHLPLVSSFFITYIALFSVYLLCPFFIFPSHDFSSYFLASSPLTPYTFPFLTSSHDILSLSFSFPIFPSFSFTFCFLSLSSCYFPIFYREMSIHTMLKEFYIVGWGAVPSLTFYKTCFITHLFISPFIQESVFFFYGLEVSFRSQSSVHLLLSTSVYISLTRIHYL